MTKEEREIQRAIQLFAEEMLKAMLGQMHAGRFGWNESDSKKAWGKRGLQRTLSARIRKHNREAHVGNEVDDANHLMMMWYMREDKKRP